LNWRSVVKVLVSAALIAWLLHRVGFEKISDRIFSAQWNWLMMGIVAFAVSNILGGWQWYLLLRAKNIRLSFWRVQSFYHVGLFFSNFLMGGIGGDAFRVYDVGKSSGDLTNALSTVFFDRFIGFMIITSLAVATAAIALPALIATTTGYIIACVLVMWIAGMVLLFNERLARKFTWISRIVPGRVYTKAREIYYSLNQLRHDRHVLIGVFGISFMVQSLRILTHFLMACSVGIKISPVYFFVFIPIIALVSSLPISVGGIGVREQSSVALFSQVGIASSPVVAFEFLAYFVSIITSLPGGIIFVIRKPHR
jgi:glycosyltransferase 2 family protein